jgi:hypothetical protein
MRSKPSYVVLFLVLVLIVPSSVSLAQSTDKREAALDTRPSAILVELFTSEGCSSCPPADALLRAVDGKRTQSGLLIVGVSEHVTYWNHLGWSDRYSAPVYTDRQSAYAQKFHLGSPYTPQMVINGKEQFVGNDKSSLLRALNNAQAESTVSIRIASVKIDSNSFDLDFSLAGSIPPHGVDVYAILADDSASSDVLRGENAGHMLVHTSVARNLTHIGKLKSPVEKTVHIPVSPATLQPPNQGHHLIVFAQTSAYGPIVAIDTKAF